MRVISLNGKWKLRAESIGCKGEAGLKRAGKARKGWIEARVPGEVHLDLMRAGRMPEPLVGVNAPECRWPEKRSWWYRKAFPVPAGFLGHERQRLVFDGLDLYAQVFLNGVKIGSSQNAFVPQVFDAGPFLRAGRNELIVRLTCGTELAEGKPSLPLSLGGKSSLYAHRYAMSGKRGWLRKPQFSYGWDWVDSLPNTGIWRGVRLEGHSHVVLHDLRLDTAIRGRRVFVEAEAILENLHHYAGRECVLELTLRPPKGKKLTRRLPIAAQVGRSPVRDRIEIPNPQLWWPNGMGGQPLYRVTARVLAGGTECDRREFDYGLRVVTVDQSPLKEGRRFCIQVNGEDVFCKGGNWVPADAVLARVGRGKYERLVAEAKAANCNMLRVWGGGVYEDDAFYDACDRAGVLVWQDFMFACTNYPCHDPDFRTAVRAEAEAAVMRLRHHAAVALWCGNNENVSWFGFGRGSAGTRIYNQVLPDVCRALDPGRFYWPGSPSGGASPISETEGDAHPWPYTSGPDRNMTADATDGWKARFVTEFGAIGPPVMDSIREYLGPEERDPGTRAWKVHTNEFEAGLLRNAVTYHYADVEALSIEEYVWYGMLFQAFIYGHHYEAQRFRKHDPDDDCQGFLIWMFNDCWGEIGWSIVDYYLRRKPSWYAVRRACLPVKVIARRRGRDIAARVVNDTLQRRRVAVRHGWMRLDGGERRMRSRTLVLSPNSMTEVARERIPSGRELDPRRWLYAAVMSAEGLEDDLSTWLLRPYRRLDIREAEITVQAKGRDIRLVSPAYRHGVHIDDRGSAMLSDNYFDLLPGVPKSLRRLDGGKGTLRFRSVGAGRLSS